MSGVVGKASLARNTAWSVAGHVTSMVIPLVMTPFVVRYVPLREYGFWIALNSLVAWLAHYDIGFWGGLTREVAERRSRGDLPGLRRLWATWLYYDLAAAALIWTAVALSSWAILRNLVSGLTFPGDSTVLALLAAQSALMPVLRHLSNTLNGLQRIDLTNRLSIIIAPLSAGGLAASLALGGGMVGMAWNGMIFSLLQIVLMAALLRREGYPMTLSPAAFSGAELRALVRFGWPLQAGHFLNQAFRSDRLLLALTGFAPSLISLYQFGAGLMDRLAGSITVLSSAILPAAADYEAKGERGRLIELLVRGTKYHALAAFGLLGFAALFANELLLFWMGVPLPDAVVVLRLMALGGVAVAVGSCGQSVMVALGKPRWGTVTLALGLGSTVILYMTVGRRYDYAGLAGAVSAGLALAQIFFMIGLRRVLQFSWREVVGNALLKPSLILIPLGAVHAAWIALAPRFGPVDDRLSAFSVLAPSFVLALALGWGVARLLKVVDAVDLDVLKSLGRRARS